MGYEVLARKWRPHTLSEMVGQEHILRMLTNALTTGRLHHAWLFTGTRGVGKTTLARILAKCLNCEAGMSAQPCNTCGACTGIDAGKFPDLLEVDAASRTKVEDTRDLLDTLQYAPVQGRFKICLIDEVHMLSGHSFNALLKTLEEPPAHVKFLLATTDPHKLPITVLSRCLQFNLHPLPVEKIEQHLAHICEAETITAESAALKILAKAARGSLRDALSLLDQAIAFCGQALTLTETRHMLGLADESILIHLLETLIKQENPLTTPEYQHLLECSPDFDQLIADLLLLLHQISRQQILQDQSATPAIQALATQLSPEDAQLYYQIALIARRDLPLAPTPADGFEMLVLRLLAFHPSNMPAPTTQTNKQATPPPVPTHHSIQENTNKTTTGMSSNSSSSVTPHTHAIPAPTTRSPEQLVTHWAAILPELNLSGMVQALAAHCIVQEASATHVKMALTEKHTSLLNKKMIERIEQALCHYFKTTIKLEIVASTETHALDTPAERRQQADRARQQQADTTLRNDPGVKKIMHLFDATLDIDSIEGK